MIDFLLMVGGAVFAMVISGIINYGKSQSVELAKDKKSQWVELTEDEMVSLRSRVQEYTPLDNVKYGEAIQRAMTQALKDKNT